MTNYEIAVEFTNYLEGVTRSLRIPNIQSIEAMDGNEENGESTSVLALKTGETYVVRVVIDKVLGAYGEGK